VRRRPEKTTQHQEQMGGDQKRGVKVEAEKDLVLALNLIFKVWRRIPKLSSKITFQN